MAALCGDLAASRGPLSIYELSDSQKAHFTATVEYMTGSRVVYIAHNEYTAQRLYEDFGALYGRDALFFPAREIMLYDVEAKEYEIVFRRVGALDRLLSGDFAVAVMSVEAAVQFVPPPSLFRRMTHVFETGMRLDFQNISAGLIDMGYERVSAVEARGTFAVRGGILDVYPVDQEYAVRVELFDDEIDSIRFFDAQTQRTVSAAGAVKILPARDILYEKERLPEIIGRMEAAATQRSARTVEEDAERFRTSGHFAGIDRYIAFIYEDGDTPLSYADGCAYVIDEPVRAFQKLESLDAEHAEICLSLIERGKLLPEAARFQLDFHDFIRRLPSGRRIALNSIRSAREAELLGPSGQRVISGKSAISYQGNVELLKTDIRDRLKDGWTVLLLTKSRIKAERLAETLRAEKIPVRSVGQMPMGGAPGGGAQSGGAAGGDAAGGGTVSADAAGRGVTGGKPAGGGMAGKDTASGAASRGLRDGEGDRALPGMITICYGALAAGFEYPKIKFIVICDTEFQSVSRASRRLKPVKQGEKINFFTDLRPGDYVVHQVHGIGVFASLEQLKIDGAIRDFLKIRYKDGDLLYIPTNQLDLVQKYVGSDARAPKVNSLNSVDWSRTKKRVKESLKTLAAELILIYAKRREASGYAFSRDTVWQGQFEEQFPYAETEDQLRSVEEIKKDMESPRLMDRLLCGDVGFGKTEVAIRAAFKAVSDSKQVAFLVPTTVLAQQHYQTFKDRFSDFPISIDVLSRFRTQKEQKQITDGLREGMLDIVIGTHKLLHKGIAFKNLGLLVVDEEQRFGVNQKEKIKALKPDVDVLSLSATPIPRTLHMSMTKIRDISVLQDPPEERYPVQTFVMEYDEDVIREAILREVAREGQVFYLYNRVMGIDIKTMQLRAMLPESVRIAYAHGQMQNRELEDVMLAFINRQYDVLICTTIIESGLDMPNVNTIIVEDADRMGLAQLYQLRGRVGRSNRLAYAYITHRRDKIITDESEKRLAAIREFTELGSGFRIAMRDMQIRGVGNLLGVEQHGHMESVGYDMYCRLLDEAVRELEKDGAGKAAAASVSGADATADNAGAAAADSARPAAGSVAAGGGAAADITKPAAGGVSAGGKAAAKYTAAAVKGAAQRTANAGRTAAGSTPVGKNVFPAPGNLARDAISASPAAPDDSYGVDQAAQVSLDFRLDAYIDSLYIDDEALRLEMYQKIAVARGEDDIQDITDEMRDRFSAIPDETINLINLARIKILAARCGIMSVAEKGGQVTMQISADGAFNMAGLSEISQKYRGQVLFNAGSAPYIVYKLKQPDKAPASGEAAIPLAGFGTARSRTAPAASRAGGAARPGAGSTFMRTGSARAALTQATPAAQAPRPGAAKPDAAQPAVRPAPVQPAARTGATQAGVRAGPAQPAVRTGPTQPRPSSINPESVAARPNTVSPVTGRVISQRQIDGQPLPQPGARAARYSLPESATEAARLRNYRPAQAQAQPQPEAPVARDTQDARPATRSAQAQRQPEAPVAHDAQDADLVSHITQPASPASRYEPPAPPPKRPAPQSDGILGEILAFLRDLSA